MFAENFNLESKITLTNKPVSQTWPNKCFGKTLYAEFKVAVKYSNFVNFTGFLGARNKELFPNGLVRFKIL